DFAQEGLQLGIGLFDRVHVGAVRRQISQFGAGEISPLALKRATQRTALAMRLAAALRDMPPSTTAPTTRSRRSSESAIPAASFPRRQSLSRSKPIRESLTRFNSLGDRSRRHVRGLSRWPALSCR